LNNAHSFSVSLRFVRATIGKWRPPIVIPAKAGMTHRDFIGIATTRMDIASWRCIA
jgi:hypothetical protein